MNHPAHLIESLQSRAGTFAPVLDHDLNGPDVALLDFSASNPALLHSNLRDTAEFEQVVAHMLREKNATVGVGGYFENRVIYRRSNHFSGPEESRNIHLGVDIWAPAHIPIYTPVAGRMHSFQDNNNFGDYGPTLILEHELNGLVFYTLYGHLSRASLAGKFIGQEFAAGEQIATMGPYPENGDWPPHVHFQVMTDMLGKTGDFPGVCAPSEVAYYQNICLNPNLLLNSVHLQ
ncbi:peptidoglycan DD-metalloendopeptidase family protein [Nibribacter ruber]|uniref:Peptidoglycan DD-metalloendopeptidase family protein n=1 Tax=Nibribacter ruber TaxID=2698458 RepID=A0A6P1P1C1_9BACT|nr:peptidoglycan DD-metalloendopeptidase family protein [Nibribacter ruber]QHL87002.1 peptidoglycan DD-metalloendopeptidase family protein [Nibribacter ruber]